MARIADSRGALGKEYRLSQHWHAIMPPANVRHRSLPDFDNPF